MAWLLALPLAPPGRAETPRLAVVVAVSGVRPSALYAFEPPSGTPSPDDDSARDTTPVGLRGLLLDGVVFLNARLDYAIPARSAGFATLATGASPSVHGIVADHWIVDRPPRLVGSWEDPEANRVVPGAQIPASNDVPGAGPQALEASTLSDAIVLSSGGRARSWSLGTTARAAVFTAGQLGKAVWLGEQGLPTSSVRYFPPRGDFPPRLPRWIEELAAARSWSPPTPGEGPSPAERIDRVSEIAARLIAEESLGEDPVPDLLHIGIDVEDPWSGALSAAAPQGSAQASTWDALDRLIGRLRGLRPDGAPWVWVVAGVRGAAPPFPQGTPGSPGVLQAAALARNVERHLDRVVRPLDWVLGTTPSGLWLHPRSILASGRSASEIQALASSVAEEVPEVLLTTTATAALHARRGESAVHDLVRRSFYPKRFPDVLVVPRPFVLWQGGWDPGPGTDHEPPRDAVSETPHAYDTHVPLIVLRPGLAPGVVLRRVSLEDVAPTLALLLRTDLPSGTEGEPLPEVGAP